MKAELKLYYHNVHYLWADLKHQASYLSGNSSDIIIPAEQGFSTVLYLLNGFLTKQGVFPVSANIKALNYSLPTKEFALAIATSGSQAKPKIAIISRENIISHCRNFKKLIPIDKSSCWLNCMPLHHIAGVMIVYRCWFNNASMLLHDGFDVQKVWQDLNGFSVSHISLVPRMLYRLLEFSQDSKPPQSLKYAIVGGDKISDSLFQRAISAGWPIYISYGCTEATSTIALGTTANQLKLLDELEVKLMPDKTLNLKGPMVFIAYVNSGIAYCENSTFINSWFATNDRVTWDGNYLSVLGRNDDMIISGGENIAPQYIESLLQASDVVEDIAIGKCQDVKHNMSEVSDNDEWGDTIVALIVGDLEKFKLWVKNKIKVSYQPRVFIPVKQIPRNQMGKVDRNAIKKLIKKTLQSNCLNLKALD